MIFIILKSYIYNRSQV